jgi:hypothetical protein
MENMLPFPQLIFHIKTILTLAVDQIPEQQSEIGAVRRNEQ